VTDRSYIAQNKEQLERMRALIARLSDKELAAPANPEWTIAATLLHIAYWDERALWLAGKIERGEPFIAAEAEPEPPTWLNDTVRPFLHAIAPREAARIALRTAEETDRRVAALPADKVYPNDKASLLNAVRAEHRREHLDELEEALRR